jgi:hypothetical protein
MAVRPSGGCNPLHPDRGLVVDPQIDLQLVGSRGAPRSFRADQQSVRWPRQRMMKIAGASFATGWEEVVAVIMGL